MCCVTSTSATARSRVACSTVKPSVQTSTTSPAVAWPRCHSTIAQASIATVSMIGESGVQQAQLFQIEQAALARRHLLSTVPSKRPCSRPMRAEGADQRHVADDIDQLAVDPAALSAKS